MSNPRAIAVILFGAGLGWLIAGDWVLGGVVALGLLILLEVLWLLER